MMTGAAQQSMAQQRKQTAKKATAVKKTTTTAKAATTASAASFTLTNGKLGPLFIGQTVASIPKSVAGLYDRYEYTKEDIENEMDGDYTLELCHFYKGGKEIFQCNADDKKPYLRNRFPTASVSYHKDCGQSNPHGIRQES